VRDILLEILFDLSLHDLTEAGMISINIVNHANPLKKTVPATIQLLTLFNVTTSEDRSHEIKHIGGANLAVTLIFDQARFDDIDLLLRLTIHYVRYERSEFNRVFLIFE
jgi:hypothetical protein